MRNQEILEKAIQKAVDSGWKKVIDDSPATIASVTKWTVAWNTEKWKKDGGYYGENVSTLIFSHDFAKALWNTPRWTNAGEGVHFETHDGRSEWQYHLQQMVIAEDPIKYLGENL